MREKNSYFYIRNNSVKKTGYPGIYLIILSLIFIMNSCEKKTADDQSAAPKLKEGIQVTIPSNLADSVVVDPVLSVTFKEGTDSATIKSTTIILKNGASTIPGTVTYSGITASFRSMNDLSAESEYVATVKSISNGGSAGEYSWKFKTGKHHSYNAVSVVSVVPRINSTDVPLNVEPLVTFNTSISSSMKSHIHIFLKTGSSYVDGNIIFLDKTAKFHPSSDLEAGKIYVGKVIIGSEDEKDDDDDKSGKNFTWSFTTKGGSADILAPTVSSVLPANNSVSVATSTGLSATFSEPMNGSTITSSTFTLKQGANSVAGSVSTSGSTAKFTPTAPLEANKTYVATILTGVKDVAGNSLATVYTWSFTTAAVSDVTAPSILSVVPLNGTTNASIATKPGITFSEPMNTATINSASFTIKQGTVSIPGTISYSGVIATFSPSAAFAANTVYTGTITTSAKDLSGNAVAANYTWNFTTAAAADVTPPTIISSLPAGNATSVAVNAKISVTFSEVVTEGSVNSSTFLLKQGSASVSGTIALVGTTATFTPSSPLAPGTLYSATITTGVKDASGNSMAANYVWSFTTAVPSDVTAPTVITESPSANAQSVALNAKATVTFSESMNSSTITSSTFIMKNGTSSVSGSVTYSGTTATFTPSAALSENTLYTCSITTGVKDLAGNTLSSVYTWSFTTIVPVPSGKSFSADVVPILNLCNDCHTHNWSTSTNASTFYSNLVSAGYVNAASPTTSKINTKVNGGHPSSTVSQAQKNTILTWMTEGSKNN